MSRIIIIIVVASLTAAALTGCAQTSVTFLTTSVPGRAAQVNVDDREVALTRGAAIAFECTELAWDYAGPCRDFSVALDDDTPVQVLPAHLDHFGGPALAHAQTESVGAVTAPVARTGALVVAATAGTSSMTVSSRTGSVSFNVRIDDPAAASLAPR